MGLCRFPSPASSGGFGQPFWRGWYMKKPNPVGVAWRTPKQPMEIPLRGVSIGPQNGAVLLSLVEPNPRQHAPKSTCLYWELLGVVSPSFQSTMKKQHAPPNLHLAVSFSGN